MVWLSPDPGTGATITGWLNLLTFILAGLMLVLGYRWMRDHLLWRLRNRLIVTYIFIGVVPVLLVMTMALLAFYIFGGQFATFVATSDLNSELRNLDAANAAVASELRHHLRRGGGATSEIAPALQMFSTADERFVRATVVAWIQGRASILQPGAVPGGSAPIRPAWVESSFSGLALEGEHIYLRSVRTVQTGNGAVTVVSSLPLDRELLEKVGAPLGRIVVSPLGVIEASESGDGLTFRVGRGSGVRLSTETQPPATAHADPDPQPETASGNTISGGRVPAGAGFWDREVSFATPLEMREWAEGKAARGLLLVVTRPSALYGRLFATLGAFANLWIAILLGVAIFFAVIELIALFFGFGLTRTITGSVARLYEATERINRGDLRHRIRVTSKDQLAALETSFNSMSESLERLIAEQKEKERLQNELAIAHEVQAQLFPKQNIQLPTLEVHGLCLPAQTVSGDYYDFLPFGEGRLGMAVGDISGKGISAALLMATLHSAVRAYALENVGAFVGHPVTAGDNGGARPHNGNGAGGMDSPAALLSLLNRHLYFTTSSEKYATLFLAVYDDHSRTFTYSNAGHLAPIVIGADGSLRRLDQGGMVIGLFDNITHDEHSMHLRPGELFVAFSDGITEPENEFGEFGEQRLIEIVHAHRDQPLARVSETVIAAVQDWVGPREQPDDVTLVLARGR
jgi:sigma-B regulation protein RsbU (phosphoserine phosphatase)